MSLVGIQGVRIYRADWPTSLLVQQLDIDALSCRDLDSKSNPSGSTAMIVMLLGNRWQEHSSAPNLVRLNGRTIDLRSDELALV
jgi:hypothetical protein